MDEWKMARRLEETNMQSVTDNYYEINTRLNICKAKRKWVWIVHRHDSGNIQAQGATYST